MNRRSAYTDDDKWRKSCRRQKNRYYGRTAFAENHNKKWTDEETRIVMEHRMTDTEIAELIGRSVCSIQHRRNIIRNRREGETNGNGVDVG